MENPAHEADLRISPFREILQHRGLKFFPLDDSLLELRGLAIAWDQTAFTVVSVTPFDAPATVRLTSSVIADIDESRELPVLRTLNSLTHSRPMYPTVLHDAEAGWDVYVQQQYYPMTLQSDPSLFLACIEQLPQVAEQQRGELETEGIVGRTLKWNENDVNRLFLTANF